jgi:hypothetical protein
MLKSLPTKTPKPKKPTSKAAYVLAVNVDGGNGWDGKVLMGKHILNLNFYFKHGIGKNKKNG